MPVAPKQCGIVFHHRAGSGAQSIIAALSSAWQFIAPARSAAHHPILQLTPRAALRGGGSPRHDIGIPGHEALTGVNSGWKSR